jgi:hypothetical protein
MTPEITVFRPGLRTPPLRARFAFIAWLKYCRGKPVPRHFYDAAQAALTARAEDGSLSRNRLFSSRMRIRCEHGTF